MGSHGGVKSGADEDDINGNDNGRNRSCEKRSNCSIDKLTEALLHGSIVGGAAGLVMHFRGSSGAFGWKAFPYSIIRGALAFGSALGIYEAAKCKIMQTGVVDDVSSSTVAGGLGTGTGGVIYGAFPWTMPNSTKVHAEKFQQFRRELPRNFIKYAAVGGVYFGLESIVLSKVFPDQEE